MKNKKIIYLTIGLLVIGLLISLGTYAYWNWMSSENKNVVFNTSKDLKDYITYDDGESKFVGDFQVSDSYLDGVHTTISMKKDGAANVSLIATINMDINAIGETMKVSPALKWVVTSGDSTNVGDVLSSGNFIGSNAGDTMVLLPNIEVLTTEQKFTIWIWIDSSENPSADLTGETLDTVVWTQIDQVEGVVSTFSITKKNATYQTIDATVVNNMNKIVSYAVTTSNTEPSTWTSISDTDQSNVYNLEYTVSTTGTYYIWFKDSLGNVVSDNVSVSEIDTSAPVCTFGEFSPSSVANGETATVDLVCTDNDLKNINLSISDIEINGNSATLSNISKVKTTNGYTYTISLVGTDVDGIVSLTLPSGKIFDSMNNTNESASSGNLTIQNDVEAPTITLSANSDSTPLGSRTVNIIVEDGYSGISSGSNIKYGWSTSNTTEPSSYTTVTVTNTNGISSVTVGATGSNMSGDYYLWVVPVSLTDVVGNSNTTTVKSTGTFSFDNSPTSPPTISFDSNYLTSNLILHYDGRNNTGNGYSSSATSWIDLSGNGRNGTINGGTWEINGLTLDGNDDGISLGSQLINLFKSNNTVELNVKFNELSTRDILIGNYNTSNSVNYEKNASNGARAYINAGAYDASYADAYNSTENAYTTTYVWDKTNGKVLTYINGELVYTHTSTEISNYSYDYTSAWIGRDTRTGSTSLAGTVYGVRVYDDNLTATEVMDNYKVDSINLGNYTNNDVVVSIDGSTANTGILKYQYSIDGGSNWLDYDNNNKPVITSNGATVLKARAVSNSYINSVEVSENILIDKTPPTGTLTVSNNDALITANVSASDLGSGVGGYQYAIDTSSDCSTVSYTSSSNTSYNFTVSSSGTYYVCVRIKDNVGNVSEPISESINIYEVSFDGNIFVMDTSTTTSDVTISYDPVTSYLTLNGETSAASSLNLNKLSNMSFKEGEKYKITITYVSGSFSSSGSWVLATDVYNSSGSQISTRNYVDTGLPSSGSKNSTLTISSVGASEGSMLRIWIYMNAAYTFSNYKIKIDITKVQTKYVSNGQAYGGLPSSTRNGYNFIGWYTDDLNGEEIVASSIFNNSANQTLYAHWEEKKSVDIIPVYDIWGSETISYWTGYSNSSGDTGTLTTTSADPQIQYSSLSHISGITGAYVKLASALSKNITIQVFYATSSSDYSGSNVDVATLSAGQTTIYIPFSKNDAWTKVRFDIGTESGLNYQISALGVVATGGQWNDDDMYYVLKSTGINNIGYWQWTYDTSSWSNISSTSSTYFTSSFSTERNQLVYYRVCDTSDNCSDTASSYVRIDKTKPTVSYNLSEGTYTTTKSVKLTPSDSGGSGVAKMTIQIVKDGTTVSTTTYTDGAAKTVSLNSDGVWKIWSTVYDNAGNYQTNIVKTYTISTPKTGSYFVNNRASIANLSNNLTGGMYRFQGTATAVTNNYICFGTSTKSTCTGNPGTYMYRIVGVTSDGLIKLIKMTSLSTKYAWHNSTSGWQVWPECQLYTKLNGSYYLTNTTYVPSEWSSKIANTTWRYKSSTSTYLYGDYISSYTGTQMYEYESATVTAQVGIMAIHDYYLSLGDSAICGNDTNSCVNSWIHYTNNNNASTDGEWTLARWTNTGGALYSYWIKSGGYPRPEYTVTSTRQVRPMIYLNSSVIIDSGTGTSSDPYIIRQ